MVRLHIECTTKANLITYITHLMNHHVKVPTLQRHKFIYQIPCSDLVHVKDPVPTLQRHRVIYQIPCSGCDKTYTGQTGRLLGTGLKEHRGSVRRHDTNSCLALHCMDTDHTFNRQDTRILGSANSQRAHQAIEALHSVNLLVLKKPSIAKYSTLDAAKPHSGQ